MPPMNPPETNRETSRPAASGPPIGLRRWAIAKGYIPADVASVFVSDRPMVIQLTRLDSRQSHLALLSAIAWAEG